MYLEEQHRGDGRWKADTTDGTEAAITDQKWKAHAKDGRV